MRTFVAAPFLLFLAGCATTGNTHPAYSPATPKNPNNHSANYPNVIPSGIVLVANGSGDWGRLSNNLSEVTAKESAPLIVESFAWSHGKGRSLYDHWDRENQINQGRRMASQARGYIQTNPGQRIYLVGHSTGCAVVLAAAEGLPPGSVEGIVLLAPSVCTNHDLRPALYTARSGIDVFYSSQDQFVLGMGMRIFGTTDGDCQDAAGLYGFKPIYTSPGDAALYQKLRQHPWDRAVVWSGNDGSHYGCIQPGFLKAYVLPELVKNDVH